MTDGYIPRLTVEITPEQAKSLSDRIPHGLRKPLFQAIVDDVIKMLDQHGEMFLAAVIAKSLHYEKFTSLKLGDSNGQSSRPEKVNHPDD